MRKMQWKDILDKKQSHPLTIYFCLIEEAGDEEDKDKRKKEEERVV